MVHQRAYSGHSQRTSQRVNYLDIHVLACICVHHTVAPVGEDLACDTQTIPCASLHNMLL